jgi:hypothetical protein
MKIKLKIAKMEKAVAIQILEMDERFRRQYDFQKTNLFRASNGWLIGSAKFSELYAKSPIIYLRGLDKETDDKVLVRYFNDNNERDETIESLMVALKEWSENWEGFKEKPAAKKLSSDDVVVFEA